MPSEDVTEFGGWPRPPRWVWAVAGVAVVAVLAGVVVARAGPGHSGTSSPSRSSATGSPVPGLGTRGSAGRWPSSVGACGSSVYLPQIRLARQHAGVRGRVLVGGAGLRQVTLGGAVSGPLPGLPGRGWQITDVVAGPGAAYAFGVPCFSFNGSVRVYRITAGAAHRSGISAGALPGGPRHAGAVTYRPRAVLARVLSPRTGGRAVTFKSNISRVADTAAGLVVAYHRPAGRRHTVELFDPDTGAVVRRLGGGSPMGAVGHVLLVSLHGCAAVPAHGTCTLESLNLTTGRPAAKAELPAGRVPVSGGLASPVFSPDGTLAAFQLARAGPDPRFAAASAVPPSDVAVLHLRTGRLDIVPGLELPPLTWAGLAFSATGSWLLATVSEGNHGELLAWRPGMPGPALVTSLPGPLGEAPPLLAAPPWWRTG